ncbi:MAG: ATP-dependent DNA helicase RecG, partial [Pseudomonadota bacterium]
QLLPEGEKRLVSGRLETYEDALQMAHPDYVVAPDEAHLIPQIEPVYPLTAGLTNRSMRKAIAGALDQLPDVPEWILSSECGREAWPSFASAMQAVHAPSDPNDIDPAAGHRRRLAYDELLSDQLALLLVRASLKRARTPALEAPGRATRALLHALPFELTDGQREVLADIRTDIESGSRMVRLLQGDVGSGKTIIALFAMGLVIDGGGQAALMAPTEILARQHAEGLSAFAEAAGLRLAFLSGAVKGRARAETLSRVAAGEVDILIGTHALFQADVAFKDLRLAVVDEQHRFGVAQRLALAAKGSVPVHLLVMTATPIPRTLALAAYGDMDLSELKQKPAGRKPITTRLVPEDRIDEITERLASALARGDQAYWVCPAVEDGGKVDMADAETRYADLKQRFGERVGLVHGRLKPAEKETVMTRFIEGALSVLVATTVIEVGVNNPNATIMVVENAERFGLAQLHQLRGRVGRGDKGSACVLLYRHPLSEAARARLQILRETEDGFLIAEEDFRLRGPGDLLGRRQSGQPYYRLASFPAHSDLIDRAHSEARHALAVDPTLRSDRGEALRVLLYLFERDEAVRLLSAG